MKKSKIKILAIAMKLALVGLITLQIFWSIKIIETEKIRFDATINNVLSNVVLSIEKNRTANILIKKINSDSGDLLWVESSINQNDSDKLIFFSSNTEERKIILDGGQIKINVDVSDDEEEYKRSGKRVLKKTVKVSANAKNLKGIRETRVDTISFDKENLISEVLEDMISFKKENYFIDSLDEKLVDSLIQAELKGNGLETEFYFGIVNKGESRFIIIKSGANKNKLLISDYYKPLSPHDIFSSSLVLKLHIPNTFGLILKSIWVMFALSLLFIIVIIFVYVKTVKMFLEQKKVTEVKNDLINNITHEFKTPISAISLATEALEEPKLLEQKDSVKRYSKIIGEENRKLTKLVETLLNTAAFEKSEIELKLEQVKIREIILDIVEKVKRRNRDINISFMDNSNDNVGIEIDLFHFTNIINNLIDNAIKYSDGRVEIVIKLKSVTNGIEISIADKGIGIKKSDQQKIFETFYRVQSGNIHDVKGNGVGLSYVKKIIEAHNGKIRVESKLNIGSTFIIVLKYDK